MNSYLTIKDVQRILQVGRTTAYGLLRSGRLPCYRVGGLVRVRPEDLKAFVEGGDHVSAGNEKPGR